MTTKTKEKSKSITVPATAFVAALPSQKELQTYTSALPTKRKITNEKAYQSAMLDYKLIGNLAKDLKAKKDSVLNPLKQATKNLNAIFKPFEDEIAAAEADYKAVLNTYVLEQHNAKQEALKQIENDKRLKNPVTIQEKINAVGEQMEGTFKVKVVKVIDYEKIPQEFWDLNESRVLAAYKAGEIIPGVEVVEEVRVRR